MDDYSAGFRIRTSRGGTGGGGTGTGTKTPTTDQIQKISSQLSFYGKIESKNVFYWFQNHKARERQKRRRVLVDEDYDINMHLHDHTNKISSTKHFAEINYQVPEPERSIETLQLFPLNSFSETDHCSDKLRLFTDACKENNVSLSYNISSEMDHPTLDLRLSFL
ncbi:hypothetical protein CDL12_02353 [Handroanthus impetiginosus]|uniref:Homeobox domain-containing protein n=1 Tax=Handroanthus impetiginosus TaxID=429701 RepID=A0A2G9I552_9LAMI|nr:hypothetical protein CDL12_02353 [Handroanthus impetiginosus]